MSSFCFLLVFLSRIAFTHTLTCSTSTTCYFDCSDITCTEQTLTCNADYSCTINCTGNDICKDATIERNGASSLNITCSGNNACENIILTCTDTCICTGNDCSSLTDDTSNSSSSNKTQQTAIIGIIIGTVCTFLVCCVLLAVIISKIIRNHKRDDNQVKKENIIQTKTVFVGNQQYANKPNSSQNLSGFDFGHKPTDEVKIIRNRTKNVKSTDNTNTTILDTNTDTNVLRTNVNNTMFAANITPGNELGIGFMAFEHRKQQMQPQHIVSAFSGGIVSLEAHAEYEEHEIEIDDHDNYAIETHEEKTFEPNITDDGNGRATIQFSGGYDFDADDDNYVNEDLTYS